ncbi:unknown protein [Arabidopsis thaliana]|uniref:Uncharacterized protein F11F8_34 n=1 Tax=Arabidopsis thaliana TaxID=3702 RepID=Q9SF28_ARATH|nr:unknown protein [Arabidopsis thaliana]AAU44472.1 hypothetical protein AT3G09750 [Arabidopsis thaliana]AAV63904.1 hypothetical protein At3g09750 [Arabidopsis thaliana]
MKKTITKKKQKQLSSTPELTHNPSIPYDFLMHIVACIPRLYYESLTRLQELSISPSFTRALQGKVTVGPHRELSLCLLRYGKWSKLVHPLPET